MLLQVFGNRGEHLVMFTSVYSEGKCVLLILFCAEII